jgi:hypothetical protein
MWWIATAIVATLAAIVALVLLLLSSGSREAKLAVESSPAGATLLVDGKAVPQRTPTHLAALTPGVHTLRLTLAGHEVWVRRVDLRGGETLRVEAALRPLSPSSRPRPARADGGARVATRPDAGRPDAPPPRADAARPRPDAPRVVAAQPDLALPDVARSSLRPTPRKVEFGQLNLATVPWATIYHGKRKLGDTPLVGVRLPVGKLQLTAVNPEERIRTTFVVDIKKGQLLRQRIVLRR